MCVYSVPTHKAVLRLGRYLRLTYDFTPKSNTTMRRSKKSSRKRDNRGSDMTKPTREVARLSVKKNPTLPIRRTSQRTIAVSAANGLDGFGSYDMELEFNVGSISYRFGGTGIYTDNLPNTSEFTNLFENWRLAGVTVRIDTPLGISNSLTNPGTLMPLILYAPDYNDGTGVSRTDLLQYPQLKVHNFYKEGYTPLMFELNPVPLRDIAGSGVLTSYSPMAKAPWLRTADFTTPHYGVKFFFDFFGANTSTSGLPFQVTIFCDLEFTNPK